MTFSIATWNINSVRLRIGLVTQFLLEHQPDVLCLQETKCRDADFPASEFARVGYGNIATHGQKGYHGVAIVSKYPFQQIDRRGFCDKGDARHIAATLDYAGAPLTVHNFYIPAGGDEPDPAINEKFAHKLAFLDEMREWFTNEPVTQGHAVLVGDLNVAPLEHDVWSHKALMNIVSHTPIEIEKLSAALAAGPWTDAMRTLVPVEEKLYTWWSYRSPDWAVADKGRRLDHVWLSPTTAPRLMQMKIVREARGWERPSDHVPVIVHLAT